MSDSKKELRGSIMLLLTALIWGFAFVAQRVGGDKAGPFTFTATRSIMASIVLLPVIKIFKFKFTKDTLIGGICCGVVLFLAGGFQQVGIQYSTPGKAGFITALYIIFVPVISRFFLKKSISWKVWASVVIGTVGLFLLCAQEDMSFSKGDILLIICAVLFSLHILVIDYFSPKGDGVCISCIQFFVCGILSAIVMLITEKPSVSSVVDAWLPIMYAGIMSGGVAYTLQIVFQKDVEPTKASLIMSLESVFAVIGGFIILGQKLSFREFLGCVVMFVAIVLAQTKDREGILSDKEEEHEENIWKSKKH